MSTYTVQEDRKGTFMVRRDGIWFKKGVTREKAEKMARFLNTRLFADEMLAILVDSQSVMGAAMADWCDRRDTLIRQINGESK